MGKKAEDFTPEELEEFIIKDNVHSGMWDHDILGNRYDKSTLKGFGLDLDFDSDFEPNLNPETSNSQVSSDEIERKAKEMAQKYIDMHKQNLEVICPECAHEFQVTN